MVRSGRADCAYLAISYVIVLCDSNAQAKTVVKALIHTSLDSTPSYSTTTCHNILRYNDKQLAVKKALSKDLIISSVLTYTC